MNILGRSYIKCYTLALSPIIVSLKHDKMFRFQFVPRPCAVLDWTLEPLERVVRLTQKRAASPMGGNAPALAEAQPTGSANGLSQRAQLRPLPLSLSLSLDAICSSC